MNKAELVLQLRDEGKSYADIRNHFSNLGGISPNTISTILNGDPNAPKSDILKLIAFFDYVMENITMGKSLGKARETIAEYLESNPELIEVIDKYKEVVE